MRGKRRSKDLHLPSRVYFKHNAYYYVDHKNKWHKLSSKFSDAMKKYGEMQSAFRDGLLTSYTLMAVFERYMAEMSPLKATSTYEREKHAMLPLKVGLGRLLPAQLTATLIYQYMDFRSKSVSPATVNKEKAVLSNACNAAVRWGVLTSNPCLTVRRLPNEKKETRYVTDAELWSFYNAASKPVQLFLELAVTTGLRLGDLLSLKFENWNEEGLKVITSKTKNPILFSSSPNLKELIEKSKALNGNVRSPYLIANKKGLPYTVSGFQTIWKRTMKKAILADTISRPFSPHDLRRKAATEAQKEGGREYARKLLGHTSQAMTAKYIGGTQTVKPLELKKY